MAVEDDGKTFYVADGYCNSRIIKYTLEIEPDGKHKVTQVMQWGEASGTGMTFSQNPLAFAVPHALALASKENTICVADRENSRVPCFNSQTGKFLRDLKPPQMGRVYGVAYSGKRKSVELARVK